VADGCGPQPGDDLQLLGQPVEPLAEGPAEVQPVRPVFGLVPAGADAELDATAGDVIDLRHRDGRHRRVPEGGGGDQRAQPDVGNLRGDRAEVQEGVGRPGQPRTVSHHQQVIGPEEGRETTIPGGAGDGRQIGVRRPLLRLGEDAQIHDGQG